jgi:ribosomal protein S18 acetylase RimI-like enzyme
VSDDARVAVRRATRNDAAAIAALHADAISEGFLAVLGRDLLGRVYRRLARSPHAALWVADADSLVAGAGPSDAAPPIAGFVALTYDTSKFYRQFLVRDGAVALLHNIGPLTRALPRTWETLRYGLRHDSSDPAMPSAEILALAVDRHHLRRGVARALLGAATDHLVARGIDAARVVTTVDNVAAHAAYAAAGFTPHARTEVHRGVAQDVLVWRAP